MKRSAAAALGVSRRGLDQAELGHVIPRARTLQAIAAAGGVTLAWLLESPADRL